MVGLMPHAYLGSATYTRRSRTFLFEQEGKKETVLSHSVLEGGTTLNCLPWFPFYRLCL